MIYEVRWSNCDQVLWSWREVSLGYDFKKISEFESKGYAVSAYTPTTKDKGVT